MIPRNFGKGLRPIWYSAIVPSAFRRGGAALSTAKRPTLEKAKKIGSKQENAAGSSVAPFTSMPCLRIQFNPPTSNQANAPSPRKGTDKPVTKPFTRLSNNTWLHDRSEEDVYRLLIDAYRMRIEDLYVFEAEFDEGSIYDGEESSIRGFTRFLDKVEQAGKGILPSWWNSNKKAECLAMGMGAKHWQDLRHAVEKSDIQDHYGESKFPMQLRMFAESIYGVTPGGFRRDLMLGIKVAMES
jgi:mitochondrial splicing suppressor protein 51